jgi:hypothetical protein
MASKLGFNIRLRTVSNKRRKISHTNSPTSGENNTKTQSVEANSTTHKSLALKYSDITPDTASAALISVPELYSLNTSDWESMEMNAAMQHIVQMGEKLHAEYAAKNAAKSTAKNAHKNPTSGVATASPGAAQTTGSVTATSPAAVTSGVAAASSGVPGVMQITDNVTTTSPAAASSISLADSATAHSHENVLPMDLALSENPPSTSANSNDFTTVVKRRHSKPLPQASIERLGRTVYLTGHQVNLAKVIAIDHAEDFQHAIEEGFGPVEKVEVIHDSIKITCSSQEQKDQFIQVESVLGHNIKVTLPHCITKTDNQQIKKRSTTTSVWEKGVIKTPLHFDQAFLKTHTGAVWAHRITVMRDGKISETPSVILAFEENIPNRVQVGLYSFKVEPYIPKPIRCGNCQRYGHKTRNCNKSTHTCPRCAGNHQFTACNSGNHATKCINCGGNHNAAYKGCIKYKAIATALKSTVTEGLTFSEALKKNNIHLRPNNVSGQTATSKQITAPTKQDSSTQTETTSATQTDIPNHDLAEIVKATVDTVNWLLGQIKVTANQKSLLEALQKQFAIFTTLMNSKKPNTTIQIPGNKDASKNVTPKTQT